MLAIMAAEMFGVKVCIVVQRMIARPAASGQASLPSIFPRLRQRTKSLKVVGGKYSPFNVLFHQVPSLARSSGVVNSYL